MRRAAAAATATMADEDRIDRMMAEVRSQVASTEESTTTTTTTTTTTGTDGMEHTETSTRTSSATGGGGGGDAVQVEEVDEEGEGEEEAGDDGNDGFVDPGAVAAEAVAAATSVSVSGAAETTDADADAEADTDAEVDSAEQDVEEDSEADAGAEADAEADTEADAEADAEAEVHAATATAEAEAEEEEADGGYEVTTPAVFQLIDVRGDMSPDMEAFATQHVVGKEDGDLITVAILGARGTGKSTLLNQLFDTDFEISRPFAGRGTTGAVLAASPAAPAILLLDSQGADGRDGDASADLVGRVATFSLAFADVLLFNVWAADLGRFEAAGYGLLRTIFCEFIKVFQPDEGRRTLLQFVVRDHDDGSSVESLRALLRTDLDGLWAGIEDKPAAAATAPLDAFFDLDVVALPHIRHRAEEFYTGVAALRARFLASVDGGGGGGGNAAAAGTEPLLKAEYSKAVPADALGTYAEVVWSELAKDRAAALPSKTELVAAYRCDLASDAAMRVAAPTIGRWTTDVDRGRGVPGFGTKAATLLSSAMDKFDSATLAHAGSPARTKKRTELHDTLAGRLRALFHKQILGLQNAALTKYKELLLSAVSSGGGGVTEEVQQGALRRVDEWFSRKAEELLVPSLRMSFRPSRLEVHNVLSDYTAKFKDSPTVQLQAMRRLERQASRPPSKPRNVSVGLGLTGAVRPRGYGNVQLVTGYSRGPHVVNMTVCNDADAAEQEGQGKVPFFRLQPTLNFDIDL